MWNLLKPALPLKTGYHETNGVKDASVIEPALTEYNVYKINSLASVYIKQSVTYLHPKLSLGLDILIFIRWVGTVRGKNYPLPSQPKDTVFTTVNGNLQ